VIAADPQTSEAWSRQLIKYAEEQVDHLTQRMRVRPDEAMRRQVMTMRRSSWPNRSGA
jgi:hypothetical protein